MSDKELDISIDNAFRQTKITASKYLRAAYDILEREYDDWSVRDAIELAKVMASDFETAAVATKLQEIRDVTKNLE